MSNNSRFNALKTGAHARETLLPWESRAEFEKHRAEIVADLRPSGKIQIGIVEDIVANRWARERARNMTAIATERHPFGRELGETGASSWQAALAQLRRGQIRYRKSLQNIAASMGLIAEGLRPLKDDPDAPGKLKKLAQKVFRGLEENLERLVRIEAKLDLEEDFFAEYSPKGLEQRIKLESALDAHYDKMRSRLVIEQEARSLRDKVRQALPVGSASEESPAEHGDQIVERSVVTKAAVEDDDDLDAEGLDSDEFEPDDMIDEFEDCKKSVEAAVNEGDEGLAEELQHDDGSGPKPTAAPKLRDDDRKEAKKNLEAGVDDGDDGDPEGLDCEEGDDRSGPNATAASWLSDEDWKDYKKSTEALVLEREEKLEIDDRSGPKPTAAPKLTDPIDDLDDWIDPRGPKGRDVE